ncbi:hypothetical protein NQ176_g2786 [Zarea fungicola]|uniref:Uncharacterized protein n=1 Tax=Zarea fungicola TaxID=93591 RepID=A0ACC1NM80_9HYPO|nr:hypothetical protein NQ176_g2786 [Lecanicillium fungicola]
MLSSIPNTLMGPSERRNLLKMIWRVARYREAARFLYRTAKKFPVIRDMQIVMVSLPKTAFRSLPMEYQADFLVTCARLQVAHRHQSNVARVTRLLGRPGQSAEELFTYQSTKTLREGKIHAEIQLIYYLGNKSAETSPESRRIKQNGVLSLQCIFVSSREGVHEAVPWKIIPCLEVTSVHFTERAGAPLPANFGELYPQQCNYTAVEAAQNSLSTAE